jgi:outer membrane receptor protein involved in Fe transport
MSRFMLRSHALATFVASAGRGVEVVRRRVGAGPRVLLGAAISFYCVSAEVAFSQPAPEVQPAPQSLPPATETPPPAAPRATEAPAVVPDTGKPLPTIAVTAERPKQRAATTKPASGTSRRARAPAAATPAVPVPPAQGAPNVGSGAPLPATAASQMRVTGDELLARPITRPGEIVEAAPGLIAIEHSDAGKANVYYLRGYDLEHGTDLATYVDDMPINLRTHVHGQGYTDLNFLMPESVNALDIEKGPYFANEGDFANAGTLHIGLRDTVEQRTAGLTLGSFGFERLYEIGSTKVGEGNLLVAGEAIRYNGPWVNPDDMRKFDGMMRYSQGTATDGFSATAMAYSNKWYATDQVPFRAIASGVIPLNGALDPTDGGNTSRLSLSARVAQSDDAGSWKANAYLIRYTLDLYNNYEWFTPNAESTVPQVPCGNALPPGVGGQAGCPPKFGDQFHQRDDRVYAGGSASRTYKYSYAGLPTETTFGIQTRYDAISLGLTDSYQRTFLANIRTDRVGEGSIGIYGENTIHWTKWFRTTLGWRGDYFEGTDNSIYDQFNSGRSHAAIGSPKASLVVGPFNKTEFFLSAGMGFHSNDVRGTTITEYPVDRILNPGITSSPLGADPLLVRTRGAEVGVRTKAVQGLDSSVSLFFLDQASELVFDGDKGQTAAGRPSERYGVEFTNNYRPVSWVHIDANLALSHARFLGFDYDQAKLYQSLAGYPEAQFGNLPGNYVFNAPWIIASAGVTLGDKHGWFGALRWRFVGPRPLTEDDAFKSPPFNVFNAQLGYRFDNAWRVQLDVLNVLNSHTDQSSYAYGSLLKSDQLYAQCSSPTPPPVAVCQNGVMDRVLHPVEPLAARMTLVGTF